MKKKIAQFVTKFGGTTLSYAGGYDSANSRGYAQAYLNGNGASKSASSTHTASGKGSTSLSC